MDIKNKLFKFLKPSPVSVRHAEYSMLFSVDDEISKLKTAFESSVNAYKGTKNNSNEPG